MSKRTVKISKSVWTEVDVDVEVTDSQIIEALKYEDDFDELLEELGFIRKEDLGMEEGTILESMKLELIKDLMQNATLDQLERFRKTL